MIRFIKNSIKKQLDKPFATKGEMYPYPFNLKDDNFLYCKRLGSENPDKKFYVIWRDNYGTGFFSNYVFVVCHLLIAIKHGFIPIIDFKNFKTLYNENEPINGTENAWEYYFQPLNEYSLDEVYRSQNVFFCEGEFPKGYSFNLTEIQEAYEVIQNINYNSTVKDFIQNSLTVDSSYLGIHFRGKEQNLASYHPFGATYKQVVTNAKTLLQKYDLSKIFIVTEDPRMVAILNENFPGSVFHTDSFRSEKGNAYNKIGVRKNHRYLLGLEILRDAHLLSQCAGILYTNSNVNEYSRFINKKKYKFQCEIWNGCNSANPIYAKFKYRIAKRLPKQFGGLLNEVILLEQT